MKKYITPQIKDKVEAKLDEWFHENVMEVVEPVSYTHLVTPLEGLKKRVGNKIKINYAAGCDLITDNKSGFDEAGAAVKASDMAVVVVGSSSASLARDYSDATCGEGFDLSSLDLTGVQEEMCIRDRRKRLPLIWD